MFHEDTCCVAALRYKSNQRIIGKFCVIDRDTQFIGEMHWVNWERVETILQQNLLSTVFNFGSIPRFHPYYQQ